MHWPAAKEEEQAVMAAAELGDAADIVQAWCRSEEAERSHSLSGLAGEQLPQPTAPPLKLDSAAETRHSPYREAQNVQEQA